MLCKQTKLNILFFFIFIILCSSTFAYDDFKVTDYGLEWISVSWNQSPTENITIKISEDLLTWYSIKELDEINYLAVQPELQEDTIYYLNMSNATSSTTITQKTLSIFESNYFYYYTVLLIISVGFIYLFLYTEDYLFSFTSGFTLSIMSINIFRYGFANIHGTFLLNSIAIIFLSLSFVLLALPSLNEIGDNND